MAKFYTLGQIFIAVNGKILKKVQKDGHTEIDKVEWIRYNENILKERKIKSFTVIYGSGKIVLKDWSLVDWPIQKCYVDKLANNNQLNICYCNYLGSREV